MRKYSKKIAMTVFLLVLFLTDSVSASEVQNQNLAEESLDATFNITLLPIDGFDEEIQFLFVSENGEYEYDVSLSKGNSYRASFVAEGNTTYQLFYYYESYQTYEIEALQEEYVCENATLWNLNFNIIERISPVENRLFPLGGDMTEEELESMEENSFTSSDFPDMSEEEVVKWYYDEVKRIINSSDVKDGFSSITNGIRNDTTRLHFISNSGSEDEWEQLSDEKLISYYYACALPSIIIENNDFDFKDYIEKLNILHTLCDNIECKELYDITYTLWEYIWEYQRTEKQMPNFATNLLTEFRAEERAQDADGGNDTATNASSDMEYEAENDTNIFLKYIKEHLSSIVLSILGGGIFGVLYYKNKKEGRGKVKR